MTNPKENNTSIKDTILDRSKESKEERNLCEEIKKILLSTSPKIKILRDSLKKSNCNLLDEHFKCEPCDDTGIGYFDDTKGAIIICQNHLKSKSEIENTIVHELVHAYDWWNFNYKYENCYHNACTEIRAASISEDCSMVQEFLRGKFNFKKHHQECVKRRAILSISYNPHCSNPGKAKEAVDKVFDSCYYDLQPFSNDEV